MFEHFFYPNSIDSDTDFLPMMTIDEEEEESEKEEYGEVLPVLAIKNTVLSSADRIHQRSSKADH